MFFFIWIHTDFVDPCLPLHYHFSQKLYLSTYLPVFFHLFTGQTAGRLERSSGTSNPKPPLLPGRARPWGFTTHPWKAYIQFQGIHRCFRVIFAPNSCYPKSSKIRRTCQYTTQFYPTYSGHKYFLDNPAMDSARRNP